LLRVLAVADQFDQPLAEFLGPPRTVLDFSDGLRVVGVNALEVDPRLFEFLIRAAPACAMSSSIMRR